MPDTPPALLWFRDDLRLGDHPALTRASATGLPLLCVYVIDESGATRAPGAALKWWLHGALAALRKALEERGGTLLVLNGDPETLIPALAERSGAEQLFCHYRYQEEARQQDDRIAEALSERKCTMIRSHGTLLRPPESVATKSGTPYRVFGAWWKAFRACGEPAKPCGIPDRLSFARVPSLEGGFRPAREDDLLLPRHPDWSGGLQAQWEPGEEAALEALSDFVAHGLATYESGRNELAADGSARLSPYLNLGILSPRQVWHRCLGKGRPEDRECFLSELGWRDFSWYVLFHQPQLPYRNLKPEFDRLIWRTDPAALNAWQKGRTGIPVVDAGMRQLWETGWMHNRARMIVASFLVKHLLIDWREGEAWFRDTLVDADVASNAVNWQWVAGTGIEASPFFRIFNPVRQAATFDPHGDYIRRWVPELSDLPDEAIAAPWDAPEATLRKAGVTLGETYPAPIVDLGIGRDRAMKAYRATRRS